MAEKDECPWTREMWPLESESGLYIYLLGP